MLVVPSTLVSQCYDGCYISKGVSSILALTSIKFVWAAPLLDTDPSPGPVKTEHWAQKFYSPHLQTSRTYFQKSNFLCTQVHKKKHQGINTTFSQEWHRFQVFVLYEISFQTDTQFLCKSWNCLSYAHQDPTVIMDQRDPRPLTLTVNPPLPSSQLNHVGKCHMYTSFNYLLEWWPHHYSGQHVPVLDKPFHGEFFPNIQS